MPTNPPTISAPRLRSSCDGCGTAKVKCDRNRPQCVRCTSLGLTCVYGPSRKHGKPARKRPAAEMGAIAVKRICSPRSAVQDRDQLIAVDLGEDQIIRSSAPVNTAQSAVRTSSASPVINPAPEFDGLNQLVSGSNQSLHFEGWSQLDEWQQFESFGIGLNTPLDSLFGPANAANKNAETQELHSCPRESYEIFRDLICPSPSLHAPESNSTTVSAQLDQVLQFNRNAIERLSQVLKCPCAKSGHRAMVHASIVSRILIWYQQAAGWTGSSSWGPRPSAPTGTSTSSPVSSVSPPPSPSRILADDSTLGSPSLVQATGFAVEHVPFSVGAFNIEDENVLATFRNQLILSELKKMANLIKLFMSQGSGDSTICGSTGLYSHLGTWLQSEQTRTIKILKSRLKTLNENLEF